MRITLEESPGREPPTCTHLPHVPSFDAKVCLGFSAEAVRSRYPRFEGQCALCRRQVILYASLEHMRAGQWGERAHV